MRSLNRISIVLMTFRRTSDIYLIRSGESGVGKDVTREVLNSVDGQVA